MREGRLLLAHCRVHYLYKYMHEMTYALKAIRAMHPRNKEEQHSICTTCRSHVVDQPAAIHLNGRFISQLSNYASQRMATNQSSSTHDNATLLSMAYPYRRLQDGQVLCQTDQYVTRISMLSANHKISETYTGREVYTFWSRSYQVLKFP
jgi:hypothetical protein